MAKSTAPTSSNLSHQHSMIEHTDVDQIHTPAAHVFDMNHHQEYSDMMLHTITQNYVRAMKNDPAYQAMDSQLNAHVPHALPLLSLVMIIKNEASGLVQTLLSTLGHIDHYCLVDTGSTDDTLHIIFAFYQLLMPYPSITYTLFMHEPFVDFSTTRNRALFLTGNRTEFVLMMNGDDRLQGGSEMRAFLETRRGLTALDEGIYIIPIDYGGLATGRSERLARNRNHFVANWPFDPFLHWRFEGVTHEAYMNQQALQAGAQIIYTSGSFGVYHDVTNDTPEKKTDRFHLDIELLLHAIEQAQTLSDRRGLSLNEVDPNYARNVYYLAQSYYNLNDFVPAMQYYKLRVKLNYPRPTPKGEDNEKHRAYSIMAHIAERQGESYEIVNKYWRASYDACPAAWSVMNLARVARDTNELKKAKQYADKAMQMARKGSPVVCNGDDPAVQKSLPTLIASINTALRANDQD